MLTTYQIRKYRKHIIVDIHAVQRYQSRVEKVPVSEAVRKLKNAYLRGKELTPSSLSKILSFIKYQEEAVYIKYGNVIVVATNKDRYSDTPKKILTCYLYKDSKFDKESTNAPR